MKTYRDVVNPVNPNIQMAEDSKMKLKGANQAKADAMWQKASDTFAKGGIERSQMATEAGMRNVQTNQQSLMQNLSNITQPVLEVLDVEMRDNAKRRGLEQAQNDLAEIDKLKQGQEIKKAEIDRVTAEYSSYQLGEFDSPDTMMAKYKDDVAFLESGLEEDTMKLQSLLKKDSAFSISENVRAESLNQLYMQKVELDTNNTINQLYLANKNDPEAFEEQAKKLLEGLTAVPDKFRTTVEFNITQKIKDTKYKAKENLKNKQLDEITAVRTEMYNYSSNVTSQKAYDGTDTTLETKKIFDILDAQVKDGSLTATEAQNRLINLRSNIETNKVIGTGDRILNNKSLSPKKRFENILEYADKFMADTNANLDNNSKLRIHASLVQKANNLNATIKSNGAAQEKDDKLFLKNLMQRLETGKIEVSSKDIQRAEAIAIKNGDGENFKTSLTTYTSINDMNMLNVSGQQQYVNSLKQHVEIMDAQGKSTFGAQSVIETLDKQLASNMEMITKDVNGYVEKHPMLANGEYFQTTNLGKFQPAQTEDGGLSYAPYNKGVLGEFKRRYDNKYSYQAHLGKYESISDNEAHTLQQNYNAMNPQEKFQFLGGLGQAVGFQESNNIFKKMFKDNPSTNILAASIFSYGTNADKNTATFMIKGGERRASKEFTKLPTTEHKLLETATTSNLLNLSPNVPLHKEAVLDYYYGKTTNVENFDSSLMEEAITNVLGVRGDYNNQDIFEPSDGYLNNFMEQITVPNADFFESQGYELPDNFESFEQLKYELNRVEDTNFFTADDKKYSLEFKGKGKYAVKSGNNYITTKGRLFIIDTYINNPNDKGPKVLFNVNR